MAQNRTVKGKVTDEKGAPVDHASVVVKGTTTGTTTSADGSFSISVPATAKALVISSLNFTSQEVALGSKTAFDVVLKSSDESLQEVVVTAYGTVKKSENTSSTAKISAQSIKDRPLTNISAALDGAAPGISVTSANGQPGSGQSVRIRGFGSINAANDPLYVIDGAPYSGNISNINMDDVESISVLKDAASTALYGSRGSNGVVIITTKKGKKGNNQMNVKVSQGFTSRAIPEYERVDAFQYYPLMWQALRNSLYFTTGQTLPTASTNATNQIKTQLAYNPFNVANNDIVRTDGTLNPNAQLLWGDDLDWNKDIQRQGTRGDYAMNFSGGNEKTDYFASFNYLDEKGFIIRSDLKRFNGRVAVNAQPLSWFKAGFNAATTISRSNLASDGSSTGYVNPFFFNRTMGPIYPLYAHDQTTGAYLTNSQGQRFYDYGNMSAIFGVNRPGGASPGRHVTEETKLNQNDFKRYVISARVYGEISFTKELKFTTNISMDQTNQYASTYDNNIIGDGAPAGRASKQETNTTAVTFNQLLTYNKKINKHNFNVLVGHESYKLDINDFSASRQNQVVSGNYDLDNFTTTNSVSSQTDKQSIESYLSRVNYDFGGKYFLSASFRRDGNSRFAPQFRWANFWSVGGAWVASRENFFKVSWVDELKVRTSYGQVGNDAGIGYYPYQALYALGFNNNAEPGIRQSSLPSDSITWETAKSYDFGIDFSLFKNRLSGTIEYYNRKTDGLIFGVQLPLSLGAYTLNKNIGAMVNKGIEINLQGEVIRKRDFSWTVGVNVTTLKNEITQMPTYQPEIISGTKKLKVGQSIYDFWLREWRGVNQADGAALYTAQTGTAAGSIVLAPGDTVSTSQNNAKFVYQGSAIPDFYGSFNTGFKYKNFDFSVTFTYQVGGKIYDATYAALMHTGTYGTALHKDALAAWDGINKTQTVTNVPRMDNSKGGVFDAASTRWLTDASFLNLRSLTFGYNVPKKLVSKITANGARFYITGENLQWFSARKGMSVQQSFTGVTSNAYVPAKIVTVGLTLNF
jgi:TonB-linked SusC/RagA family outer membrane protein